MDAQRIDELWPPCGPCAFCGGPDKRHRLFDVIRARHVAGESIEDLAADYECTVEHIHAALAWVAERTAYTLGNEANYDRALAENDTVRKTGAGDQARDPDYPGGSVWRTEPEARAWQGRPGNERLAVYEVSLPDTWDRCTEPAGDWHSLLVDAVIVRKVEAP